MTVSIQILRPGDEERLEAFAVRHADSSMFLRANPAAAGLVDTDDPRSGTYAAAVDGDGRIVAVAAHSVYGTVVTQAPAHLDELVRACVAASGREVVGLLGPWAQVVAARAALQMNDRSAHMESRDILFGLDLADLVVPAPLARGEVRCRRATDADLDLLAVWRAGYHVELLGDADSEPLRARCRSEVRDRIGDGCVFVLERSAGELVAMTSFNATLPDIVQVGGVWTPPELRSRGYARAAVAGSLVDARERGVTRAVLFTGDDNIAAQRPYRAIGFAECGDYGLILFD